MHDETTLGAMIAHYRKLGDLTQRELAEQVGVSAQAVSRWEQGASYPDITLLPALAQLFNVSTDELFGRVIEREITYSLVPNLPWPDDDKLRVALYHGTKLVQTSTPEAKGETSFNFKFHNGKQEIKGTCKYTQANSKPH